MKKITILRRQTDTGYRWYIEDWNDYLDYLEENNMCKPIWSYGIVIDHETAFDFERQHGDFEKHVPLIFHLDEDKVEYEIKTT